MAMSGKHLLKYNDINQMLKSRDYHVIKFFTPMDTESGQRLSCMKDFMFMSFTVFYKFAI